MGIGIAYPASKGLALLAAESGRTGGASASLQIAETLGMAVGTGTSGAPFTLSMQLEWGMGTGVLLAFIVAATVLGLAFIPASRTQAAHAVL